MSSKERQRSGSSITVCKALQLSHFSLTPTSWADAKEIISVSTPTADRAGHVYVTTRVTAGNCGGLSSAGADSASYERYEWKTFVVSCSNPFQI